MAEHGPATPLEERLEDASEATEDTDTASSASAASSEEQLDLAYLQRGEFEAPRKPPAVKEEPAAGFGFGVSVAGAPLEVIPENQVLDTSESFYSSTPGAKGEFLSDPLPSLSHALKDSDVYLSPTKHAHEIQGDTNFSDVSKELEKKLAEPSNEHVPIGSPKEESSGRKLSENLNAVVNSDSMIVDSTNPVIRINNETNNNNIANDTFKEIEHRHPSLSANFWRHHSVTRSNMSVTDSYGSIFSNGLDKHGRYRDSITSSFCSKDYYKRRRNTRVGENDPEEEIPTVATYHPDIDKGWAWIVLVVCFSVFMIAVGLVFTANLYFMPLLNEFGHSRSYTAWVGSLLNAFSMLGSIFSSSVIMKTSCRTAMILGSVMMGCGYLMSAFAPSLEMIFITFGVIVGLCRCRSCRPRCHTASSFPRKPS